MSSEYIAKKIEKGMQVIGYLQDNLPPETANETFAHWSFSAGYDEGFLRAVGLLKDLDFNIKSEMNTYESEVCSKKLLDYMNEFVNNNKDEPETKA
jgi:hypothetical protein